MLQFLQAPIQQQQLQISENITDFSAGMGLDAGAVLHLWQDLPGFYLSAKRENMAIP